MDTKFQTSFIPKKTLPTTTVSRDSVSVFFVLGLVVFLLTLTAAGGVYVYKRVLIGRIGELNQILVKAKNAFEPELIDKLKSLNKRIESGKRLVGAHTAVSPLFELLENKTLATVKFDTFYFEQKESVATVALAGQAKNFSSIALQSDIFGADKAIKNPVFSDLNPDQSGNITFKFAATLDGALTSYANLYKKSAGIPKP